jgi:hypothetical protein
VTWAIIATGLVMFGPAALVFGVYGLAAILPSSRREHHRHAEILDVRPYMEEEPVKTRSF